MQPVILRAAVLLATLSAGSICVAAEAGAGKKTFTFRIEDRVTIRSNPTTQIAISVKEWPGQTFLLWMPEDVRPLWNQWTPAVARQNFSKTERGGLLWSFTKNPGAVITAELIPREASLLLEVRVTNRGSKPLANVMAQNCLHFSQAPGFACDDFSRIHIRTGGAWKRLSELKPKAGLPMYYRSGFLEAKRRDSWGGDLHHLVQKQRADHPLIACTSKDGRRTVATVAADYECVYHNRDLKSKYLYCIHSHQAPLPLLAPGKEKVFRQCIYFLDGTVADCVRAYDKDRKAGLFGEVESEK